MKTRAAIPVLLLWLLGALGVGLFVAKPKFLDKDSRKAATSVATTTALVDASTLRGAFAAASVTAMVEANVAAPDSPARNFIAQEGKVALANLPAPDPQALIDAEKRKNAVLEGKLELTTQLYEKALHQADGNASALARALAAKRGSDQALVQEAAERLGASRQARIAALVAICCLALWLYVKLTHLSPGAVAQAVVDMRAQAAGTAPAANPSVNALDGVTSRLQQGIIHFLARLKTPPA